MALLCACSNDEPLPDIAQAQSSETASQTPQFHSFNGTGVSVELAASGTTAEPVGPPTDNLDTESASQPFVASEAEEPIDSVVQVEIAAPEPPAAALPAETITVVTPVEPTIEVTSAETTAATTPVETTIEETSAETTATTTPVETTTEETSAETTTAITPVETTVEVTSAETTAAITPVETTIEETSAETTSEITPAAPVEAAPASLAQTSVAVETAPEPVPVVEPSSEQFPQATTMLGGTLPASDISLPAYRETVNGLVDSMQLTRISTPGVFGGNATHQYSKRSAFNSSETLMEIGDAVVNKQSLDIINPFVPVSSARVWSHLQPDIMYGIRYQPDPNVLAAVNVRTNDYSILRTFSDYNRCSLGNSEGNLSNDDGRVVLACDARATGKRTLISYDITSDQILGTLDAKSNYNWVGISQSGQYIVVENNAYPDPNPELIVYDAYFQSPRNLGGPAHGDFGYDDSGDEVYVMIGGDVIWYVRLNDGLRVNLSISNADNPIGHGHISCRNLDRPGWCYFSAYKDSRLGAVRISAENSVVEHWGYHRSTSSSYSVQPKASVGRSGTQMVFTSDWLGSAEQSDFLLQVQ